VFRCFFSLGWALSWRTLKAHRHRGPPRVRSNSPHGFFISDVILNLADRLYSPLLAYLHNLISHGLVRPKQLHLIFVTSDVKAAIDHIQKNTTDEHK
jgi:hypothetical protein